MIDAETYRWDRFTLTFYYNTSVAEVFAAWATNRGLERFFIDRAQTTRTNRPLEADEIFQPGDQYVWTWRQPFSVSGKFVSVEENECIVFSFGAMRVSVYFQEYQEQTEVWLVQDEIPDTPDGKVFGHLNCRSCWLYFMTNLQSVLHHGHDLRDAEADRVSSMEVGFVPLSGIAPDLD